MVLKNKSVIVIIAVLFLSITGGAWTYTTPPLFECLANGTCQIGNTKINETAIISDNFRGDFQGNFIGNGTPFYHVKAFGAVGNGITDDTAAINNALATPGNKTVSCSGGGIYNISTISVPAMTTFEGGGSCTLRWAANVSTQTAMLRNTNQESGLGGDYNIVISGIIFDDYGFSPGNTRGIYFKNVTNSRIIDNTFLNFSHAVGLITQNSNIIVERNNFSNYGVVNGDAITATGGTVDSKFINNFMNTTRTGTVTGIVLDDNSTGIFSRSSDRNVVSGNHVTGGAISISIEGSDHNSVRGNILTNFSSRGISLSQGQSVVSPDNNYVGENVLNSSGGVYGVVALGNGNVISKNLINGTQTGILENLYIGGMSRNNIFTDNTISFTSSSGIIMQDCLLCKIDGNDVLGSGSNGIYVHSVDDQLKALSISNNFITNSSVIGIYVQNVSFNLSHVFEQGNVVINSVTDNIRNEGSIPYLNMSNNQNWTGV